MKSTRTLIVTAFAAVISLAFTVAPQGQGSQGARANAQDEDATLLLSTYSDLAVADWPGLHGTAGGLGSMNDDPTVTVTGHQVPPVQTEPNQPQGHVTPPAPVEPLSPFMP